MNNDTKSYGQCREHEDISLGIRLVTEGINILGQTITKPYRVEDMECKNCKNKTVKFL